MQEVAKLSPLLVKKRSVDDLTSDTEEIIDESKSKQKSKSPIPERGDGFD